MRKKVFVCLLALCLLPILSVCAQAEPISLSELENDEAITVTVTGGSINVTTVKIKNETDEPVTVAIAPGTWFRSSSSSVQNMLVTNSRTIELAASEERTVDVSTACMNINLDIPDDSNSFSVVYDPSSKLAELVEYVEENDCEYEVIQAAVWIITDKAKDSTLLSILVNQNGDSVIKQHHIDEARRIVAGLT